MVGKKEQGFLLLELLVALALLLLVIVPLLELLVMAADTQARARRHTAAAFLARESMETVRSLGYNQAERVEPLRRRGEFLQEVDVSALMQGTVSLKRIVVTVSWQERQKVQKVKLVTYMAGGEVMGKKGLP